MFLFVFCFVIVQPQYFFIEVKEETNSNLVHASYTELLEKSKQQDGSLVYETISLDDWKTSITYKVSPWDTLSTIARDFGTTVQSLAKTNTLDPEKSLRVWQNIIISFTENYVHQVTEDSTLEMFAKKYWLNTEDLMSLNYLTPPTVAIHVGQELVLPLTAAEAKNKWLFSAQEFVPLDLEEQEEWMLWETAIEEEVEEPSAWSPRIDDTAQEVISAEETEQHLNGIKQQKEKSIAEQDEARKNAASEKERIAQEKANKKKQQEPLAKPSAPTNNSCGDSKCMYQWKCRTKPANAFCSEKKTEAWTCKQWFTDTGKSCVKATTTAKKQTITKEWEKKIKKWAIKQWYFNAKKTGYPYNWWARGHCTEYVDYRWWKTYGKQTNFRGNAGTRVKSAAKAWRSTGKTPKYWAAAVMKADRYSGVYGHVAVVIDIDQDNGLILVEEQNYAWTYVVNQRWMAMKLVSGYVYPQ